MKNSAGIMVLFSFTLADVWHAYVYVLGNGYTYKCTLHMYLCCVFIKLMFIFPWGTSVCKYYKQMEAGF